MMKTPGSYITKMLGVLSKDLPLATIRYAFLAEEELHVVDLAGDGIAALGEEGWAAMYNKWVDEFEEKFPDESLLLVRDGDCVRVSAEEATERRGPQALADTLPDRGSISYNWADRIIDYMYEVQGVMQVLIPASNTNSPSSPRSNSKRNERANESAVTFNSVPMLVGTESFCSSL